MRGAWAVAAGLAVAAVVTACGGGGERRAAAPTASPTPASPSATSASPTPTLGDCTAAGLDVTPTSVGLPAPAAATVARITRLAEACDYTGLARLALAGNTTFTATFGPPPRTVAALAEFWHRDERQGRPVTLYLARLCGLPSFFETQARDSSGRELTIYVTPRAMHDATPANRRALEDALGPDIISGWWVKGQYLGYRLGVTADGDWTFFVAGD